MHIHHKENLEQSVWVKIVQWLVIHQSQSHKSGSHDIHKSLDTTFVRSVDDCFNTGFATDLPVFSCGCVLATAVLTCDKLEAGTDLKILTGTGVTPVTGGILVAMDGTSDDFIVWHVTAGDDVTVLLADLAVLIALIVLRYSANA